MLLFTNIPHYEIKKRRFWRHFYKIIDNAETRSLHFAAAFNIPEICESLLEKGQSVNSSLGDLSLLDLAAGNFLLSVAHHTSNFIEFEGPVTIATVTFRIK